MHALTMTTNNKDTMNLKDSKSGYMKEFKGKKGKVGRMQFLL